MAVVRVLDFVPSLRCGAGAKLRLHVIYTTPDATRASLHAAAAMAKGLGARLELIVPKVVPYPLPLQAPATPEDFTEQKVRSVIGECEVEVDVKVLLCRDREDTVPRWLPAESIAVIGRRRRWGPGSSWRLIRAVKREGHHVMIVDAAKRDRNW